MNSLRDYSIPLLLPDSLRNDDFVVALGEAFETEMKEMYREAEILSNFMIWINSGAAFRSHCV